MFGFSELEDRLAQPDAADVVRDCFGRLGALEALTVDAVAEGLSARDFVAAEQILAAVGAARTILASQGFKGER